MSNVIRKHRFEVKMLISLRLNDYGNHYDYDYDIDFMTRTMNKTIKKQKKTKIYNGR